MTVITIDPFIVSLNEACENLHDQLKGILPRGIDQLEGLAFDERASLLKALTEAREPSGYADFTEKRLFRCLKRYMERYPPHLPMIDGDDESSLFVLLKKSLRPDNATGVSNRFVECTLTRTLYKDAIGFTHSSREHELYALLRGFVQNIASMELRDQTAQAAAQFYGVRALELAEEHLAIFRYSRGLHP